MHAVDSTTARRRGDHRKQAAGVDAKARLLALHIAACLQAAGRLVHAQGAEQGVAGLLGRCDGDHRKRKQNGHGRQHGPALALVAHLDAKGKAQRRRNQEDGQHLQEVAEGCRVLKRVGRVGIEEAAAIGAQHLDGFLRGHRAHGQGLLLGLRIFHHGHTLGIHDCLASGVQLGLLERRHLDGLHFLVRIQILDHTLAHQKYGEHQ